MASDVDQPSGALELAAVEGRGHALIRGAHKENDGEERRGRSRDSAHAIRHVKRHYDSVPVRPYFSIREYNCAHVRPRSLAARVLLCRAWVRALTTSERSMASRLTPPAGNVVSDSSSPLALVERGGVTGRGS